MAPDSEPLSGSTRPTPGATGPSGASAVLFHERLTPPPGWYVLAGAAGLAAGLLVLPLVDVVWCVVVGVLVAAAIAAWLVASAPVVEVQGRELRAGAARIPVGLLGAARPLDASEARHALGPGLDARSYLCMRAWVKTAVLVDVVDPADPTPSWYVSTRRPDDLAAAIAASQEAHSEQTG